jgi:small subunit ribosomal protein S21
VRCAEVCLKKAVDDGRRGRLFLNFFRNPAATFPMPIEIKIRKNEPVDRALRRLKKKLERENIIKDVRAKRYYEKPTERRRRKEKVMAFTNMLRRRYAE